MLALHIHHAKAVVNGDTCTLVNWMMMIRMALANCPTFPQLILTVVHQCSRHGKGLSIHMHHTFADWVRRAYRLCLEDMYLTQLPSDIRETLALTAKINEFESLNTNIKFEFSIDELYQIKS